MVNTRQVWALAVLLLALLAGTSAWGATITGTVVNNTGKSGRIYLTAMGGSSNLGTSIPAAGAFTISGAQAGVSYTVNAFVDTQATGLQHANDPLGSSATVLAGSGVTSVGSFAVSVPAQQSPQAPQVVVYRGNGGNFVLWDGASDLNGLPIADRYTVSWSSSPTGIPVSGSRTVWSGDKDIFIHVGGTASVYYSVTAEVGTTKAPSAWVQPLPSSGTGSVTGKVFFPGVTPTGPLAVVLANQAVSPPVFHVTVVGSPTSGGTFSATGVPAGHYEIYPVLDLNNNGSFDIGDIGPADSSDFNPSVTVGTAAVAAPDITLNNVNAATTLITSHGKAPFGEWYNVEFSAQSMKKQVVKAQMTAGPLLLSGPMDLAVEWNQFRAWLSGGRPNVNDQYSVTLTYADGSTEIVNSKVTGVLDNFPTPSAPVGYIPYGNGKPTFSWTAPSPAPAEYMYSLWVNDTVNYDGVWDAWGLPSSQTSIVYGSAGDVMQDALTNGSTYNWTLSVIDRNGNRAQVQSTFTPTSLPAVNGFSPAGGLAGTSVTITGVNFAAPTTVLFNGVTAPVTSSSATSITVTVPQGATTGKIQVTSGGQAVQSDTDFVVAAATTINGVIKTSGQAAISGAKVEVVENPSISTTTAANGSFTLQPFFAGQNVTLKITKAGYVPTYTTTFFIQGNLDLAPYPSHLYTQAELTGWGVASGKGVVIGQVLNTSTNPYSAVSGATVTAMSSMGFGSFYPVSYYTGTGFGGTSTAANGIFFVLNVNDGDFVNVNAAKSSWNFSTSTFDTHANSVTEGGVFGSGQSPSFWNFAPTSGKPGSSVVISGSYFSAAALENVVRFNGVAGTVTAASANSLTVTVPAGATTGAISVTTPGGSFTGGGIFTVRHTVTASVTGTGGALGTVYSNPAGITCRATGCSYDFDQGTTVQMTATPDGGDRLAAWSGACTGNGACSFVMNGDKTVGALFEVVPAVKNGTSYYGMIQQALDAAANGDTIQAQAQVFTATSFSFAKALAQVKLKGGYDASFLQNPGFTTLDGRLNVQNGTLRVEKVKVR